MPPTAGHQAWVWCTLAPRSPRDREEAGRRHSMLRGKACSTETTCLADARPSSERAGGSRRRFTLRRQQKTVHPGSSQHCPGDATADTSRSKQSGSGERRAAWMMGTAASGPRECRRGLLSIVDDVKAINLVIGGGNRGGAARTHTTPRACPAQTTRTARTTISRGSSSGSAQPASAAHRRRRLSHAPRRTWPRHTRPRRAPGRTPGPRSRPPSPGRGQGEARGPGGARASSCQRR